MFFLWLIIILSIIVILIITATIKIEIENLIITLPKIKEEKINKDYIIRLRIYLINKIKIIDLDLTKLKNEKVKINKQIKKIGKILEKSKFNFKIFDKVTGLNIKLEKMDLEVFLGIEDAAGTAILIGIISIFLGNKFRDIERQKYRIEPIYQNRNILNIKFSGIFTINMRNISVILIKYIKRRRVEKNGRTSNRRSYVYSNE